MLSSKTSNLSCSCYDICRNDDWDTMLVVVLIVEVVMMIGTPLQVVVLIVVVDVVMIGTPKLVGVLIVVIVMMGPS